MKVLTVAQMKFPGRYNGILLLLFILPLGLMAEDGTDKIYEQEIEVPEGTTIKTNGPGSPNMHLNGTINSTSERGAYTLKGRGDELVLKIDRRFNIYTWQKNTVKHRVNVSVKAEDPKQEQLILDALVMDLKLGPDRSLIVDCFLGIHKITMKNGWLRGNINTIILTSGEEIKFKSISISSDLTIPQTSNLKLTAKYMEVTLGRIDGVVDLHMNGGFLNANYIETVNATLKASELNIDQVIDASISSDHSKITILDVHDLEVGRLPLGFEGRLAFATPMPGLPRRESRFIMNRNSLLNRHSSLSKYTLKKLNSLKVYSSIDDNFTIEQLGKLELMDVSFSDFNISKLLKSATGRFEFGSFNVFGVGETSFEMMELSASNGSYRIYGDELESLRVEIQDISKNTDSTFLGIDGERRKGLYVSQGYLVKMEEGSKKLVFVKGEDKMGVDQSSALILLSCDNCDVWIN